MHLIETLTIRFLMKRSTSFYLDMITVLVFWPKFLSELSELYIRRSPSVWAGVTLVSSGILAGFALMRIRSMILGEDNTESKIVAQ